MDSDTPNLLLHLKQLSKPISSDLHTNLLYLVKDLTSVKQGKVTTVQDRSGKCLTEERQILNRWTEYCSELYNHKAYGKSISTELSPDRHRG